MASAIIPILTAGAGALGNILGTSRRQRGYDEMLNLALRGYQDWLWGRNYAIERQQDIWNPLRGNWLGGMDTAWSQMFGDDQAVMNYLNDYLRGAVPQAMGQFQNYGMGPGYQRLLDQTEAFRPALDQLGEWGNQTLQNQGSTFDTNMLRGFYDQFRDGTEDTNRLRYLAQNILDNQGKSNYGIVAQGQAMDALNRGGMNPYLDWATQAGQSMTANEGYRGSMADAERAAMDIISGGGYTPGMQGIQNLMLGILGQQGQTADTAYLSGRGRDLSATNPVLPLEQVLSMTRDEAGRMNKQNMERQYRIAQARGAGPGAITTGLQNQARADFADQNLSREAQMIQQALLGQQGLGLQQLGQGLGALESGGRLAAGRESMAGGLYGDLDRVAAQRLGLGGNLVTGIGNLALNRFNSGVGNVLTGQNLALNRMTGLGGLAQGSLADEISRMGLGGNLMQQFLNTQQQGAQGLMGILGYEQGNMPIALQALQNYGNFGRGTTQDLYNILTGAYGQDLSRTQGGSGAQNDLLRLLQGQGNALSSLWQWGGQGLQNLGNMWSPLYGASGPIPGVNPAQNPGGIWSQFGNLGNAASSIYDIFRTQPRTAPSGVPYGSYPTWQNPLPRMGPVEIPRWP